jgi:serine/threonine-protein kinase
LTPEASSPRLDRLKRLGITALLRGGPVAAGLILSLLLFNEFLMPRFVQHGSEVTMPELIGLPLADAKVRLAASSLALRDTLSQPSPRVPPGHVVEQFPRAGVKVKPSRSARLVISRGRVEQRVPKIAGQTLRFAKLTLSREGYELGERVRVPSSTVARNFVIATEPPQGEIAAAGERVNLLVSDGPARPRWVMPDLAGEEISLTVDRLNFAGFVAVAEEEGGFSFFGRRRVRRTVPGPGSVVAEGDTIRLYER